MLKILAVLVVLGSILIVESGETVNGFIAGGADAVPGQFPYLVSLRRADDLNFCGGAILNTRWILTAAHCFFTMSALNFSAVVGTMYRSGDDGVRHRIERYEDHPRFSRTSIRFDVTLIKTVLNIEYNFMVQPIGLSKEHIPADTPAVMAGWGQTGVVPRTYLMQYKNATIISNANCRRVAKPAIQAVRIFQSALCTNEPDGFGICGGDSGSSIAVNNVTVGVASWNSMSECGIGVPDVYVRISVVYDWIVSVINE